MNVPAIFTVTQAIAACGVPANAAVTLANGIFLDDYKTCMDKTWEELDQDLKAYSDLTIVEGRIQLAPNVKMCIKAFIQWTRNEIRVGRDPSLTLFPGPPATQDLIRRYQMHEKYIQKTKTITESAKPGQFTKRVKWNNWIPTFCNFLWSIPGRD